MAEELQGVNPAILVWARERSGRTVEEVARVLKRDPATIKAWESGSESPTYSQLESLAYKLYKRPIALFFFPAPPEEVDPHRAFRTLPEFEIDQLSPTTRFRIREAFSLQLSLLELSGGKNPSPRPVFRAVRAKPSDPTPTIADRVRQQLGVPLQHQLETWRTLDDAQKGWRAALEAAGVFVFKEAFRQDDVSGFCLYHEEFPVIYVNNSTPPTRQIFTYFHELAHILLATSGVTKTDDRYIAALRGTDRETEVFCNRFAADFLVPWDILQKAAHLRDPESETDLAALASKFKVSRETILRRFLDHSLVSRSFYEEKADQWRNEAVDARKAKSGGGDYYRTHASYLGTQYLQLAFRRFYEGAISLDQLAQHLNISPRSVPGIEPYALAGSSQ